MWPPCTGRRRYPSPRLAPPPRPPTAPSPPPAADHAEAVYKRAPAAGWPFQAAAAAVALSRGWAIIPRRWWAGGSAPLQAEMARAPSVAPRSTPPGGGRAREIALRGGGTVARLGDPLWPPAIAAWRGEPRRPPARPSAAPRGALARADGDGRGQARVWQRCRDGGGIIPPASLHPMHAPHPPRVAQRLLLKGGGDARDGMQYWERAPSCCKKSGCGGPSRRVGGCLARPRRIPPPLAPKPLPTHTPSATTPSDVKSEPLNRGDLTWCEEVGEWSGFG